MRKYFGTDGIRGVAGIAPLDPESLVILGKAIAKVFLNSPRKHRILIGKDTRLSGYMIENALASGITSMGVDVLFAGPIPTPGVAYLTRSTRVDAGIVVSASHNPFEDNGIKIFGADGYKLPDSVEHDIESFFDERRKELKKCQTTDIGKASRIDDAIGRYVVSLKSCFPREYSLEGLKIGFDGANGAGYVVGPMMLSELGAEITAIGVSPNGRNINANVGSMHPQELAKLVKQNNLDIGISLDGDGDRVILVDDKGEILDGDMILAILAIDLKDRGKLKNDTVVATVMSNLGLTKILKKYDIKLIQAAVGDRYVLEEMIKNDIVLGGEQSGHTIIHNHSTSGDGLLTALMVLSLMCRTGKKLSELTADYKKFPQTMINIPVKTKPPLDSLVDLQKLIKSKEDTLKDSGRILVRYSGTENKVRVMVESEDETKCKSHATEISELLQKEIG